MLNNENIGFIIKDLHKRGILLDDLRDEIIDHVCSAVEERMRSGARFVDAYDEVILSFGNTTGLQQTQKETAMLQNYFTIAWRSLWKNKVFSLINIFGLSIGIPFTLLAEL